MIRELIARPATAAIVLPLLLCASCATRSAGHYRLLPAQPEYVVQSPDAARTPYPDVLRSYTASGEGWVQLQPGIGLLMERAYFRAEAPIEDIRSYLGTETVRYRVTWTDGLTASGPVQHLAERPSTVPPVEQLIAEDQLRRRYHRLFYQVLLNPTDTHRVAILVSGSSLEQIESLTASFLTNPKSVCAGSSHQCVIFPTHTSLSVEIEIVVDGVMQRVPWGRRLSDIRPLGPHPRLFRRYQGRLTPVEFDPTDSATLAVPLLPGDRIQR